MLQLTEENIKKIINEELGIALEVNNCSKEIFLSIVDDIKKQPVEKNELCTVTNGIVKAIVNDVNFQVNYTYRNFFSKDFIENIDIDILTSGGSAFVNKNLIICYVNLIGINGNINKLEAINTIQHEVEHIYQEIKSNQRIPKNDKKYAKMRTDLEYGDEKHKKVAKLFYLCLKSEQEAFINGTYAWCMCDDIKSPPYTYKEIINSPAGKLYIELKDLYLELIDDNEMFSILKNEYKLSLIEIEKSIKQFLKRLGKVLIKINNDKLKIWRI